MLEEATPGAGCESQEVARATEDAFFLSVQQPDSTDYPLAFACPFGGEIDSLIIQTGLGSGVATLKIDGVAVAGIENVVIDTIKRTYIAQDLNDWNPGQTVIFEIASGGGGIISLNLTVPFSR